jgi:phosphoribosylamine--glycine ligase
MNVLVLGGGAREHALAWKIKQSEHCQSLFIAPGNAGTEQIGTNLPLSPEDFTAVKKACLEHKIDLVLVGPEVPLVQGIVDYFHSDAELQSVQIIGPGKTGAQLEGSKEFAKQFMERHSIPTAAYRSFNSDQITEAQAFLEELKAPYVLKADGLAAGKGVLILDHLAQAKEELASMLEGRFGDASKTVVIEEFLKGREFSVFALTDGKNYTLLPAAKDYKRVGEGDTGPNTGGMGAVSPVSFLSEDLWQKVEGKIVKPTVAGLNAENFHYHGFLFFGLIEVAGEPYVIEYNVRMGDPETEVVMPRIKSDLLASLNKLGKEPLMTQEITVSEEFTSTVIAVSEGYPGSYAKGCEISGLSNVESALVFHAGTKSDKGKVLSNGGRVLALTGVDQTMEGALAKSYQAIKTVCFEGISYREDIGFDL